MSGNGFDASYVPDATSTYPQLGLPGIDTNSILLNGGGAIERVGENDTAISGRKAPFNFHLNGMWEDAATTDANCRPRAAKFIVAKEVMSATPRELSGALVQEAGKTTYELFQSSESSVTSVISSSYASSAENPHCSGSKKPHSSCAGLSLDACVFCFLTGRTFLTLATSAGRATATAFSAASRASDDARS